MQPTPNYFSLQATANKGWWGGYHVIWLLHRILQQQQTRKITLRNDNGSQFVANVVRQYLADQGITQEFTHVATPEENCFIEAYHSIVEKQLLQFCEFADIVGVPQSCANQKYSFIIGFQISYPQVRAIRQACSGGASLRGFEDKASLLS